MQKVRKGAGAAGDTWGIVNDEATVQRHVQMGGELAQILCPEQSTAATAIRATALVFVGLADIAS